MHRFKLFGFAFLAVCAFGVVTAMAGASAAELPEFATNPGVLHGTGGPNRWYLEGTAISCTKYKDLYSLYPKTLLLGTFDINFEGCEQKKKACWGLVDSLISKEILVFGSWHLVPVPGQPKHDLVLLLLTPLHIECDEPEDTLILLRGRRLWLVGPAGVKTKHFEGDNEVTGTHQKYTKYENDSGEEVTAEMTGSLDGGVERSAAESSSENKLETEVEDELTK